MATALRAVRDGLGAPRAVARTSGLGSGGDAVRWWRVHEVVAAVVYWLLLVPAWAVHKWIPIVDGRVLLFALLITLAVVPTLRLHLWFVLGAAPTRAAEHHARYRNWLAAGDAAFALTLVALGGLLAPQHTAWAILFVSFGLGSAVVAAFVEPRTAEDALAALGRS